MKNTRIQATMTRADDDHALQALQMRRDGQGWTQISRGFGKSEGWSRLTAMRVMADDIAASGADAGEFWGRYETDAKKKGKLKP